MENSYKVGVVGYGWAATAHIDAINATDQGEVIAVVSSRALDPAELEKTHGTKIAVFSTLEAMLADGGVDAVSVTSYPSRHRAEVEKVAAAGKHVIIEKPLGLTLEDCTAMREAVSAAGVKSCVCFELRFISQFSTTMELIGNGMLGDIHYGEVDYYHGVGPWYGQYRWNTTKAEGGSSLLSAGCHAMDALLLCMGGEIEEVTSYATQSKNPIFQKYEYPTTTATILKFADGRIAKCASVIDCMQPYYFHTHLVGSEGSLLDNKLYSTKLGLRDKKWADLPVALADSGDVHDHPYQAQFQAFFDAIDRDEDMPLTSLNDAYRTFEAVFAADKSVEEGRAVKISELR